MLVMWVKQCHKPSPSHHHVYRWYGSHSQSWVAYFCFTHIKAIMNLPFRGWFIQHYATHLFMVILEMVYCCFTNISNSDVVMMIQWNLLIHYDFIELNGIIMIREDWIWNLLWFNGIYHLRAVLFFKQVYRSHGPFIDDLCFTY